MWINFWCSKPSVFVEVETWVFPPHHMCDIRCFTGECVNNEGHSLTSMLSQQPLEVKVTGFEGIWSYWWWFWNPKANHLGCMKLWNPVNNGIFTISTGVGFLLSTVVWHQFSHRLVRYYWCNICMHIFIFISISISISIFIFIFIYIYVCRLCLNKTRWAANGKKMDICMLFWATKYISITTLIPTLIVVVDSYRLQGPLRIDRHY